MLKVIS